MITPRKMMRDRKKLIISQIPFVTNIVLYFSSSSILSSFIIERTFRNIVLISVIIRLIASMPQARPIRIAEVRPMMLILKLLSFLQKKKSF